MFDKTGNRTGKTLICAAAAILALCLLAGAVFWAEGRKDRQLEDKLADHARRAATAAPADNAASRRNRLATFGGTDYQTDHRIQTYLFVGTDFSGNEEGKGSDYTGSMADYLLLMVLDYTDDSYGCIQIDRNTVTPVDEVDYEGTPIATRDLQICTAHWYGANRTMSARNTVNAVKGFLGDLAAIDGYYIFNMKEIQLLNHTVGGVTVTMDQDHTDIDPLMTRGAVLTLSDSQAEAFVRSRSSLKDSTNAARMGRQKQYMEALFRATAARSQKDPRFASTLWETLRDSAVTDLNGNAFSRIAQMFLKGEDKGILVPEGENKLGKILGDGELHEEFYADEDSVREIMTRLYSLQPAKKQD